MPRTARPLSRRHMPSSYAISLDHYVNRTGRAGGYNEGEQRIPEDFGPLQSMRGFEKTYRCCLVTAAVFSCPSRRRLWLPLRILKEGR